jgi:RimJ/RimL family protein N-acetyltransferase
VRINIRPIEKNELEWLLNQRNNPILYNNFNQPVPLTYEQQLLWYENEVLAKKTFAYIILLDHIKIGYIALQNINWVSRSAEISHFLDPEYDEIFALAAHISLLGMAFDSLNLNRIHSICFEFNSIYKALCGLGFQIEGTAREVCFKNNRYWDGYYISILNKDFKREEKIAKNIS